MKKRLPYKFLLYIAGNAPHSSEALLNLHALCQKHLPGRHEIEVVDVLRQPERALADGVLLTPLLVKIAPGPPRKIIGRLERWERVMAILELPNHQVPFAGGGRCRDYPYRQPDGP